MAVSGYRDDRSKLTKASHDVAPRDRFEKTFDRVYALANEPSRRVNAQELALVFIILAQGNVFNIEIASDPTVPEELLRLSELALIKGDFLSTNTVAGVQTLVFVHTVCDSMPC
jgi:hypothetical protein